MSRRLLIYLALFVVTLGTYAPALTYDFVGYDDQLYVTENEVVQRGLTWDGVRWAFSRARIGNYHPLTLLSHMLDVELFGLDGGRHHLGNVLLHAGSAMLLFATLRRMTGRTWPSAAAAALFAWHPLRVESVAWVAERKDTLSTFFWIATTWAYARYAQARAGQGRPGAWYVAACALLGLGLLAKSMLVTLPFALLLLDYWPLRRTALPWDRNRSHGTHAAGDAPALDAPVGWRRLVVEKIPMFALCLAASALAYLAQAEGLAVGTTDRYPIAQRVANATVSYAAYLANTVAPRNLAVFYPHPSTFGRAIPAWKIAAAAALLLSITGLALALVRRAPYLLVGWLWYLGTLVPVIGLVQIGRQAMADRYTYVPSIGLAIAIAWGVADLVGRLRIPVAVTGGAVAAILVGLVVGTRLQLRHWRDGIALFERAAAVVPNNYIAHYNLGVAAAARGELEAAARHYARAVESLPTYPPSQNNLGAILEQLRDAAGAERHYRAAIAADPHYTSSRLNLGRLLVAKGEYDEAIEHLQAFVRLAPSPYEGYATLGFAQLAAGRTDDAIASLRTALALRPKSATAATALARVLLVAGRRDEAMDMYRHALSLDPDEETALAGAAWLIATDPGTADRDARAAEAVRLAERARDVTGGEDAGVLDVLGAAYAAAGRFDDAIRTGQAAAHAARQADDTTLAAAAERRVEGYRSARPAGTMDAAGAMPATAATTTTPTTMTTTGTRPAPAAP